MSQNLRKKNINQAQKPANTKSITEQLNKNKIFTKKKHKN